MVYDMMKNAAYRTSTRMQYASLQRSFEDLSRDDSQVEWKDLGAPSSRPSHTRKVSALFRLIRTTPYRAHLLHHLSQWIKAESILELGTGCGVSTCYLRHARPASHMVSVDGQAAATKMARAAIARLGLREPRFVTDTFYSYIDSLDAESFDLVLIDGDHRGEAMLRLTTRLQRHLRESALIIYDDIYWSHDMTRAWRQLCDDDFRAEIFGRSTICLDLYHYGIIMTDPRIMRDESMAIIDSRWKPWTLGW